MKTMTVTQARAQLEEIIKGIEKGEDIAITYGKNRRKRAVITSYTRFTQEPPRRLGTLVGKGKLEFHNWSITDNELVSL